MIVKVQSTIATVIVTHNRREQLCNCLYYVSSQTHCVDYVIVVDNASTDNSQDYIRQQGLFDKLTIKWVTLSDNEGGAGGFARGIEEALDLGVDYIWLMDDDGYPDLNCLQKLLEWMTEDSFIGPLVVACENISELAFPLACPDSMHPILSVKDLRIQKNTTIKNSLVPFNGVLISTKIVRKLGVPKKEMFIWGDDIEYLWRIREAKFRVLTIINAYFYHPKKNSVAEKMFFDRFTYNDTNSPIKFYCQSRNSFWNWKRYYGFGRAALFFCKTIWFYSFTKPSKDKLLVALSGMFHGMLGDFKHHRRYLLRKEF